jgi:Fic family protein
MARVPDAGGLAAVAGGGLSALPGHMRYPRGNIEHCFRATEMPAYQPPCTLTPALVTLAARIGEAVGELSVRLQSASSLRLRRLNRIRSIHGSLAIEGNTLSETQITAILDGKRVLAPPREIQEARNALAAYEQLTTWRPEREADLLAAHRTLMLGLVDDAGAWRAGGVGVMAGDKVIHVAPQADRVPQLMRELLHWLSVTDAHPLVASSIFHYEFEFIHPFSDGNGRMGRMWQTLILSRWQPLFRDVPVESLVYEQQAAYYQAIQASTREGDSAPFVEFMLDRILQALTRATPQVAPQVTPQVERLLLAMRGEMSREAMQEVLDLQDRKSFRERYLKPALADGLIEMSIPDKPNSRLQKYRLTDRGRHWRHQLQES